MTSDCVVEMLLLLLEVVVKGVVAFENLSSIRTPHQ